MKMLLLNQQNPAVKTLFQHDGSERFVVTTLCDKQGHVSNCLEARNICGKFSSIQSQPLAFNYERFLDIFIFFLYIYNQVTNLHSNMISIFYGLFQTQKMQVPGPRTRPWVRSSPCSVTLRKLLSACYSRKMLGRNRNHLLWSSDSHKLPVPEPREPTSVD